jgi:hypothetical protein
LFVAWFVKVKRHYFMNGFSIYKIPEQQQKNQQQYRLCVPFVSYFYQHRQRQPFRLFRAVDNTNNIRSIDVLHRGWIHLFKTFPGIVERGLPHDRFRMIEVGTDGLLG